MQDDINIQHLDVSRQEKLELFFRRDAALTLSRALIGGLMALANYTGGFIASSLSGVAAVGLGMIAVNSIHKFRCKALLHFYRDEIAAHQQIPALALTPEHLRKEDNPEIQHALASIDNRKKFYTIVHAATAALMVGLVEAAFHVAQVPWPVIAAGAAAMYNEAFRAVENLGTIVFDADHASPVTAAIQEIEKEISVGGDISPTQVLSIFIHARPQLARQVEKEYGTPYDGLHIAAKRELVERYDPELHITRIAGAIVRGSMNPTELAYIVHGQRSGVRERESKGALTETVAAPRPEFLINALAKGLTTPMEHAEAPRTAAARE